MPSLAHKRGTRAQIDAAATANQMRIGEVYLITDEARLTVGTAVNAHQAVAKQGEGGGTATDLRRNPVFVTDFTHKSTTQNGFAATVIGAGTISTVTPGDANHPGQWLFRSSTTANSGAYCVTIAEIRIGGGEVYDLVFSTRAAFAGLTMRAGLFDTVNFNDAPDGAYFELTATGAIVGKTANNSTRSTTPTIVTLVANTYYHLRITVNANATLVTYEVFSDAGALLGSQALSTNIPTAAGRETGCGIIATNSGTVAADLITADFMQFRTNRALARGALG